MVNPNNPSHRDHAMHDTLALVDAFTRGDHDGLLTALSTMPPDEIARIIGRLAWLVRDAYEADPQERAFKEWSDLTAIVFDVAESAAEERKPGAPGDDDIP